VTDFIANFIVIVGLVSVLSNVVLAIVVGRTDRWPD